MSERDPLSGADNAWRRMGTTDNLMAVTGVLTFEEAVTYEEMCDRLETRLLRFERFRQRVEGTKRRLLRPYWKSVDGVDVENHVFELALPEPADQATFERFVGGLMSRPLDERRPLWEMYLVENVGPPEGNAAVMRINHSVGDGFALLNVMLGLVDNPEELEFPVSGVSPPPAPGEEAATADGGPVRAPESDSHTEPSEDDPMRRDVTGSGVLDTVSAVARVVKTGYDLVTMPDEARTSLFGELGQTKRVSWTRQIDLGQIKEIGEVYDGTVNDVLVAVTAGAIRRVLDERGEDTDGLELRCTVPVNLKPMSERTESLGNYFGIVFLPIPVGTRAFTERIDIVRERMDVRKAGIEAFLMYNLIHTAGKLPESIQNLAMKIFEKQATGVVTNVPGPVGAAKIAGKEIRDIVFWVPQANDQGLGISIISYNGNVRIGVAADANLLPEPRLMADAFETELDALFEELEHRPE